MLVSRSLDQFHLTQSTYISLSELLEFFCLSILCFLARFDCVGTFSLSKMELHIVPSFTPTLCTACCLLGLTSSTSKSL